MNTCRLEDFGHRRCSWHDMFSLHVDGSSHVAASMRDTRWGEPHLAPGTPSCMHRPRLGTRLQGQTFQACIHGRARSWEKRWMWKTCNPAIEIVSTDLKDSSWISTSVLPDSSIHSEFDWQVFPNSGPSLTERAARRMHSSSTVASAGSFYFIGAAGVLIIALYVKPRRSIGSLLTRGKMLDCMGKSLSPHGR